MPIELLGTPYLREHVSNVPLSAGTNSREMITRLLLAGEDGADITVPLVKQGLIPADVFFDAGRYILEKGEVTVRGVRRPLTANMAGRVLRALQPSDIRSEPVYGALLNRILNSQQGSKLPKPVLHQSRQWLEEQKRLEMQARVVHLLYQGKISLYPYASTSTTYSFEPQAQERRTTTGRSLVTALATIPEFYADFNKWCREVLSVKTEQGTTLPFVFSYILGSLGYQDPYGEDITMAISEAYKDPENRERIRQAFRGAIVNSGTGDKGDYLALDNDTFPAIYDNYGRHPRLLELTASRGVVILGTLSRMKSCGIEPVSWMIADIYHPEELWQVDGGFKAVSSPENPWDLVPFDRADREQTHARVRELMSERNYDGFVRADFEEPDFTSRVLQAWRHKTGTGYPDVVRMTATLGVTSQCMENLIKVVKPDGGSIIIDGNNSLDYNEATMWQVFRDRKDRVRLKLLYSSD